jgi:hypothetical protein
VLLKGAGHSPQLEKPTILAAVLAQALMNRTPHKAGSRWWKVLTA